MDVRRYDPHQKRDPDGEWGDGIPGPDVSDFTDGLGIDDLVPLDPGDRLGSSDRIQDDDGEADLNWVVVFSKEYGPEVRMGVTQAEESDNWHGDWETEDTAILDPDSVAKLRTNMTSGVEQANQAARDADKAWNSGQAPTDPKLLGSEPVVSGEAIGGGDSADLTWDIYLTDDEPTSWRLDVRTNQDPDSSGVQYDPKGAAHLLSQLGRIEGELRGPLPPEDARAAATTFGVAVGHRSTPSKLGAPLPYWYFTTGRRQSAMPELPSWMTGQRSFQPDEHPRAPTGTDNGGQFAKAVQSSKKAAATTARPKHQKPTGKPASRPRKPDDGTLAYDPESNQGTGYGNPRGDDRVHALQQALNRLGLKDAAGKPLKDDGKLGPKTTAAVKALQTRLGLKADGKVTSALLAQVKSMKSLPPQKRSGVMDFCVRSFGFQFEERSRNSDGRTLEGYAAVFNTPTRIAAVGGDFDEVITPGAFTRSIRSRMPVLQFEHGRDPRVGAVPIGAIEDLSEDSQGLHVRATLFDNPVVEPVRQAIAGRAIKGMSFRFNVVDGGDQWTRRSGNIDLRAVGDADVHELGPVVFPAYDTTTVSVRSLLAQLGPEEHRALLRELAHDLRSADLTDLTGQPAARSGGSGETGAEPERNARPEPQLHLRQRLDDGALRARGILL